MRYRWITKYGTPYCINKTDGLKRIDSVLANDKNMVTSDAVYKNLNSKLFYIPKSNITDCNNAESGIICGYNVANAPSGFTGYIFLFTFSYNGDANYRIQFGVKISSTDVYLRRKTGGSWDSWQLLAKL